jgi:Protein of unknown function (DUF1360)
MAELTDLKDKLAGAAQAQQAGYARGEDRPLRGYAATMTAYAAMVGAVTAAVRLIGREVPNGFAPADITLGALATHKLSRLLAKDPVTSPLRAPFTAYQGATGPAELDEDVRGQGGRKAVGELVTCPFCTGVWVATGLATGLVFFPKATRVARDTLAMLAGADLLQFTHAVLRNAAQ